MIYKKIESQEELRNWVRTLKEGADRAGKKVLADADMLFWRGVNAWVGQGDGPDDPVTINMTHFGKKKTNGWEPYANWYLSFTRVDWRRKGYAKGLARIVRAKAIEAGCVRMKALTGTLLGYHLHRSLGDEFWALTDKREILVDTPIVTPEMLQARGRQPFPIDSTPMSARKWTAAVVPLTQTVLAEILKSPLRYEV